MDNIDIGKPTEWLQQAIDSVHVYNYHTLFVKHKKLSYHCGIDYDIIGASPTGEYKMYVCLCGVYG